MVGMRDAEVVCASGDSGDRAINDRMRELPWEEPVRNIVAVSQIRVACELLRFLAHRKKPPDSFSNHILTLIGFDSYFEDDVIRKKSTRLVWVDFN